MSVGQLCDGRTKARGEVAGGMLSVKNEVCAFECVCVMVMANGRHLLRRCSDLISSTVFVRKSSSARFSHGSTVPKWSWRGEGDRPLAEPNVVGAIVATTLPLRLQNVERECGRLLPNLQ